MKISHCLSVIICLTLRQNEVDGRHGERSDQAAKQKYKEFYDKGTRPRFFEEGESVLLLMRDGHSKLEACYSGPFTIERKISPVTYQIATPGRGKQSKIVHVNLLKRWTTPTVKALAVSIIPDGMTEDEGEVVLLDDKGANNPMLETIYLLNRKNKQEHF